MLNKLTPALQQAEAVLDHAAIVTGHLQALRDTSTDAQWDEWSDGPMGELLMALTDLEYEVENS